MFFIRKIMFIIIDIEMNVFPPYDFKCAPKGLIVHKMNSMILRRKKLESNNCNISNEFECKTCEKYFSTEKTIRKRRKF